MTRPLSPSFASLLLLSAAAVASTAGCNVRTDDVYSSDENSSNVGAIARGEVRFPVALGTAVPNVDGIATTKTRTMSGVKIDLMDMYVRGTCESDASGRGEFYYQVDVGARPIARRSADDYQSATRYESFSIAASRVFFVEPDEPFRVQLAVSEYDDTFNGGDDLVGTRRESFTALQLSGASTFHTVRLGTDDCGVDVTYQLYLVQ